MSRHWRGGLIRLATLALAVGCTTDPMEPPAVQLAADLGPVVPPSAEAACLATPLPGRGWKYHITPKGPARTVQAQHPWPGRKAGDVHAALYETVGPQQYQCTPKTWWGGSSPRHPAHIVEVGTAEPPRLLGLDVKVCQDVDGKSKPTAENQGSLSCPHAFGTLFPAADFATVGPYPTVTGLEGPRCTIFRPATLGANGERHPIILWANGITLWPNFYRQFLAHLASHGFVVAAGDTSRVGQAGTGQDILGCLDYLEAQSRSESSPWYGKLNIYRVGAAGHSAGGAGVITAGQDPRITATAPIQPWVGLAHGYRPEFATRQNGPMFLSSGSADTEIPAPHHPGVFDTVNVPIFWGTIIGGGHNEPLFTAGRYRAPTTAWFRYLLMLDPAGAAPFQGPDCGLCTTGEWDIRIRIP